MGAKLRKLYKNGLPCLENKLTVDGNPISGNEVGILSHCLQGFGYFFLQQSRLKIDG